MTPVPVATHELLPEKYLKSYQGHATGIITLEGRVQVQEFDGAADNRVSICYNTVDDLPGRLDEHIWTQVTVHTLLLGFKFRFQDVARCKSQTSFNVLVGGDEWQASTSSSSPFTSPIETDTPLPLALSPPSDGFFKPGALVDTTTIVAPMHAAKQTSFHNLCV